MLSYISYRSTLSSLEYFKDNNADHQGLCIYAKDLFDGKVSTILPNLLALANIWFFFLIIQQRFPVMDGTIDKAPIHMSFKEVNVRRTK